jgi:exodeoxyribonuclease VII large subunit
VRPGLVIKQRHEVLEQAASRLREQARHRLRELEQRVQSLQDRLRLLGPEQVLARGYSITMKAGTGAVVRSAAEVRRGDVLKTRVKDGELKSRVEE